MQGSQNQKRSMRIDPWLCGEWVCIKGAIHDFIRGCEWMAQEGWRWWWLRDSL